MTRPDNSCGPPAECTYIHGGTFPDDHLLLQYKHYSYHPPFLVPLLVLSSNPGNIHQSLPRSPYYNYPITILVLVYNFITPLIACPQLDYSTIYHNLMENSVTLHILMDDDFMLSKKRASKYLFGVDSALAYTNKDYERLVGDAGLRKQVKLPKDKLGLCASLALETNGTLLAGAKLQGDRPTARRFSTVAGARAALSPARCAAARCECRERALHCRLCADPQALLELSFFSTDDIDDLIDMAMEPPTLPSFS
ncbi:hypothetical protein O3G_MSEX014627 [Manduca sexta]|uniref:Uncharacterized protein n=1 Tax=Manduca sexta TaxID=7130 RepID=A0A921ZW51_MANSE|nr:hypothetical protein O3G_MSEX014627 [Manduca sexta]